MLSKVLKKKRLQDAYYTLEGLAVEGYAILTGLWGVLNSGMVVRTGGLKMKKELVVTVLRYGFTAARQVRYAAEAAPNKVAIIDDLGQVTYKEMRDDVMALSRSLCQQGYGKGTNIAVMLRNSRVPIYMLGAKGFIGANIFLFNVAASSSQLVKSIEEYGIDLLVLDEEFVELLPSDFDYCNVMIGHADDLSNPRTDHRDWLTFQQLIERAPGSGEQKLPIRPKEGPITIMSSGTSGTPKGVVHREPIAPTPVADIAKRIPWRSEIIIQQSASIFHSWGWANINIAMAHRATVILRRHFNPEQAMDDLAEFRPEGIVTSPIFIKEQLRVALDRDSDVSSVKFVVSSGNALHADLASSLIAKFGPIVSNLYGSTENSVCTIATADDVANRPETVGKPLRCVRMRVLDDQGRVLPPNVPGKIHCRGAMSMRRYALERDREKMVVRRGLMEIGDRGFIDDRGNLVVLGRIDDMIIVGGENVYPRSVEEALHSMPGIRDLFVQGVEDEETFARLAVWVVKDDTEAGRELTKESVQQWVRNELAEHSVPRDVIFMESLPRNPTGKVMPRKLPMPAGTKKSATV
ncbi:AMP-binding protein [Corynebacterium heidelbergense]|uniref:Acyl-CoA synthetase n=1 Tax=Corynebacterium heidelbergense TaxID=2055947 RepID=A0A364VCI2_9CORY|nr:AMP-binding protein [Corynebacterium heidelbergense]RAV34334.1 acyl-CoA synthetase [Corynebacterium heidelbergense]WCZ35728.1 Long-chain-fatty-acid--CoA ligase [Corynebacterium heidelbergense]